MAMIPAWVRSCEDRLSRAQDLEVNLPALSLAVQVEEVQGARATLENNRLRHDDDFSPVTAPSKGFYVVRQRGAPSRPRPTAPSKSSSQARGELEKLFSRWEKNSRRKKGHQGRRRTRGDSDNDPSALSPPRKREKRKESGEKREIRYPGWTSDPDDLAELQRLETFFRRHPEECATHVLPRLQKTRQGSMVSFRKLSSWFQDKSLRISLPGSNRPVLLSQEFALGKEKYAGKNAFEVFARGPKVLFMGHYETTLGQLRFFKHMLSRGILQILDRVASRVETACIAKQSEMEEIIRHNVYGTVTVE